MTIPNELYLMNIEMRKSYLLSIAFKINGGATTAVKYSLKPSNDVSNNQI